MNNKEIYNEEEKKEQEKNSFIYTVFEWLDSFVISFIAVVILFTFFLGKVKVDGHSMQNTLQNNDQLIITDFCYTPKRGDIVIVSRNPENLGMDELRDDQQPIVKRVIAVGGDTIEITEDGDVLVNDEVLDEPYIKEYALNGRTEQIDFTVKQTVPKGCIFVMGDNRNDSHDSRAKDVWMVDQRYVLGKVLFRVFPFDQMKFF